MKKVLIALLTTAILQGCQSQPKHTSGMSPTVQLGATCKLAQCVDCAPVNSCPLGRQDIVGTSCSCPTPNGIQYGQVSQ